MSDHNRQGNSRAGLTLAIPIGQQNSVGTMQVMPATGQDLNIGDISEVEPNIHAGVKYMRRDLPGTNR